MTIETTLTWYSPSEKLPLTDIDCLIIVEGGFIYSGTFRKAFFDDDNDIFIMNEMIGLPSQIKYWAKIPEVFNEN